MTRNYKITDDWMVAVQYNGDPWTDDFFTPKNLLAWVVKKLDDGAGITFLEPPREEEWGGPHFGWTKKVRVIAEIDQ